MAMMANKIGAVATVVHNHKVARESITHDEANFISICARYIPLDFAVDQHIKNILKTIIKELACKEVVE
jgi:ribose 5-phosphate isomerase RpiB